MLIATVFLVLSLKLVAGMAQGITGSLFPMNVPKRMEPSTAAGKVVQANSTKSAAEGPAPFLFIY